jgi:myb proto-oncogene protein
MSSERDGGGRKKRKRRDGSRSTGKKRRRWRQSAWSRREDTDLMAAVQHYGEGQWARIAAAVDSGRTGKQCRDRWLNKTTNGNQRRSAWTVEEERQLVKAHKELGNKWAAIARTIGNKSENCVKNRWWVQPRSVSWLICVAFRNAWKCVPLQVL